MADQSAADRKAIAAALIARRRGESRQKNEVQRVAEDATTESHSGIRIVERCMRQEKWDACMRGKQLVRISNVDGIQHGGAQDQVVIGVLCAPPRSRKEGLRNEVITELRITDVAKQAPLVATIVLTGTALNLVLPDTPAPLRVGAVLGLLNPAPTGRAGTLRVKSEKQVAALGRCPALQLCRALGLEGKPCGAPYNAEADCGCAVHGAGAVPGAGAPRDAAPERSIFAGAARPTPCRSAGLGSTLVAMEAAAARLHCATADPELLAAMAELEAVEVDARLLRLVPVYDRLGDLARRSDKVGLAAKGLRRSWRALLDADGGATPSPAAAPNMPPSGKRRRV